MGPMCTMAPGRTVTVCVMEPLPDENPVIERLKLSPRKLAIAGGSLAVVAVVVALVVFLVGRNGGPDQAAVATELKAAIGEVTTAKTTTGSTARFDTAALRNRLEGKLDGWFIDLAADSGATRVGAAARQLDGTTCVFAWSDVGAPRSAVVTDPALPCVAEVALIPSKSPA